MGETRGIQIAVSERWDAALGIEITNSGNANVELVLEHDLEMRL
jgi:hypothetical protein